MKLTLGLGVLSGSNLLLVFGANAYVLLALGAGSTTDAFFGSLALPQLVAGILMTPMAGALVPQLAGETPDRIRRRGWSALSAATVVLGSVALLLAFTAPYWVVVLLPGFQAETRNLTASLSAIQMFGLVFGAWLSVVTSVSQAKKKFIAVEVAELVANVLAIVALILVLSPHGIVPAAWIFAGRPLLAAVLLLPLLGPPGMLEKGDDFLREFGRRLRAPLFGSTYIKMGFLVDRLLCSWAPAGLLSIYHLADKLVSAGVDVVRSSLVTPAMPTLAEHAKSQRWTEFKSAIRRRLKTIALVTGAFTLLLVLSLPLLYAFSPGLPVFRSRDTREAWQLLVALQGQLVAGSLAVTLAYAFYALGDTGTPTRVTMAATSLGILLKIFLFPIWLLVGVALSTSFLQCFNTVVMGLLLRSRMRKLATQSI